MAQARWKWPKAGTCRVCGCVDARACEGGCWWIDVEHTLCSTCAGTPADLAHALRWISQLRNKFGAAGDVAHKAADIAARAYRRFVALQKYDKQ